MEEEETLGESASPIPSPSPQDGQRWSRCCEPWPVQVQGCLNMVARAQPSLPMVPLIQPPIEGRRHQARGQSTLPQKVVVILPAQLVRGFQAHP